MGIKIYYIKSDTGRKNRNKEKFPFKSITVLSRKQTIAKIKEELKAIF